MCNLELESYWGRRNDPAVIMETFTNSANVHKYMCRGGRWWKIVAEPNAGFRPACRYMVWSLLAVSWLQLSGHAALAYRRAASLPSWIEFNCMRSSAVGKADGVIHLLARRACRLVIPLRQVVLAQLYKYHQQGGKPASSKLVWKQH